MEYVDESAVRESSEQLAKAIANGRRLELLEVLAQGERSVDSLARNVASSISTVSAQLQVLRRADLV
ncbi:MAG TPA: ArsR family transcriptional regulator, partial [Actinomycetales bacterium]|nr:ArsR family transcriptional regulator [Actinomycetales bacterium]